MPRVSHYADWETTLRDAVRNSTARGWSVREQRGGVRLLLRFPGGEMRSVALPFEWSKPSVPQILARVRNIYLLTLDGYELSLAADIAAGKAVQADDTNWQEAMARFRQQKLHHGAAIQPRTWQKKYEPVLALALQQLAGPHPPSGPADLLDACLRDWPPGSRTRQIRAQSLSQFLRHCVEREHFPEHWRPPDRLQAHIGVASRERAPGHRKGDPFDDLEILALLDALPTDAAGRRWGDAIRLLAELGLRPIELQHLSVRREPASGELIWWCDYRKRSGGGMTEPRRVHPLPLTDWDGRRQEWRLLPRWQRGELELPPLGSSTPGPSDAINTYLGRQAGWKTLRERLAERGERAVPYSFRHSYSLRGHRLGVDAGSVALSMGHSLEVHLRSYPWASGEGAAAAFSRALS